MVVRTSSPPDCFMTSYNKVNGLHADMNVRILNDRLRNEWGFRGLVVSDWGGTSSTVESLIAGLDLEMPGQAEQRESKLLKAATEAPTPELLAAIDTAVTNYSISRKIIRKVAADGIVLLKNTQKTLPLPLQPLAGKQVAFIGPNALQGTPGVGGSASLNLQYQSYMMGSFQTVAASQGVTVSVKHALGAYARKWLPLAAKAIWRLPQLPKEGDNGQAILRMDFCSSPDLSGPAKKTHYRSNSYMDLTDTCPADFQTDHVPPFSLSSVGGSKLYVDGELVVDNGIWYGLAETFYTFGSAEKRGSKHLTAQRICRAIVGLDEEWESEGYDRQDMALPGDQNRLVDALVRQAKRPERLVFVNQSGSPVELPWIDRVSTFLQVFYGGQEAGKALADVLFGLVNPSGRLPIRWSRLYSDLPFSLVPETWPGKDGSVDYKEES
ncbi:unnamed protein product, partial [Clonostachys chloroleuca]